MSKNRSNRCNKRNTKRPIILVYIVNVIKSDDKKETAFQQLLEFFLYFFVIIGVELLKTIITEFIKTGEFSVTFATLAVAVITVIFALLKEKIQKAIKELTHRKASSKKNRDRNRS